MECSLPRDMEAEVKVTLLYPLHGFVRKKKITVNSLLSLQTPVGLNKIFTLM